MPDLVERIDTTPAELAAAAALQALQALLETLDFPSTTARAKTPAAPDHDDF